MVGSRSEPAAYVATLLIVALATMLRHALGPLEPPPFLLYWPAIVFVVWRWGRGPGVLAAITSAVIANILFIGPDFDLKPSLDGRALFMTGLFTALALGSVELTNLLHTAHGREQSAAADLRRERARIAAIIETIPGVVWEAWGEPDAANQRIDYVSAYVSTMLGYSVEEWQNTPNFWLTIVHPDDRERAAREASGIFESGGWGVSEFRWIAKDGRVLWVHSQSVVIKDEHGRSVGMRSVTLDVTSRVEAQRRFEAVARLAQSAGILGLERGDLGERIARAATEVLADACIVRLVEGGHLVGVGWHHSNAEGQAVLRAIAESEPSASIARVFAEKRSWSTNAFDVTELASLGSADREIAACLLSGPVMAVPMMDKDVCIGIMSLWRKSGPAFEPADVRLAEALAGRAALALENARLFSEAQHAWREAERASQLKDEFLATLSHELRTPLNAIVGWSQMLKAGTLDAAKRAHAADAINRNALAQSQLVSDILDMQRVVSGKLRLDARDMDLCAAVQAAVDTVTPSATAKGVELSVVLDPKAGACFGDPDRLQQVVWNLLSNAVKFTQRGGRIRVRLYRINSHVELVVEDNGPGIAPEFLRSVFDRFRQADSSTTRRHGGLGLGLAIAKSLVELHGGSIAAANVDEGTGAVFTVKLPLRRTSEVTPRATTERKSPVAELPATRVPSLSGVSVLVIDDDDDARELARTVLEGCGARVSMAASADEGLALADAKRFDVALCDIHMPEADGFSFIRRLRMRPASEGGRMPVAAVTAAASAADRMRVLEAGFQMHVSKPVQPVEVAVVVANLARGTSVLAEP